MIRSKKILTTLAFLSVSIIFIGCQTKSESVSTDAISFRILSNVQQGDFNSFYNLLSDSISLKTSKEELETNFNHYHAILKEYQIPSSGKWDSLAIKVKTEGVSDIKYFTIPLLLESSAFPDYIAAIKLDGKQDIEFFSLQSAGPKDSPHGSKPTPFTTPHFNLNLNSFEKFALVHDPKTDTTVENIFTLEKEIIEITDSALLAGISDFFDVINSATIDNIEIGNNIDIRNSSDIKILMFKYGGFDEKTFEVLIRDNNLDLLTIREYYYLNIAKYYKPSRAYLEEIGSRMNSLVNLAKQQQAE